MEILERQWRLANLLQHKAFMRGDLSDFFACKYEIEVLEEKMRGPR